MKRTFFSNPNHPEYLMYKSDTTFDNIFSRFGIFLFLLVVILGCDKNENETDSPTACFTYEHEYTSALSPIPFKDSIVFANCSQNATSYLWDFGDGTTSTEPNPVKVYEAVFPIIVTLTAYNGTETNVLTDTIKDWAVVYKPNIYIYPESITDLCVAIDFPQGGKVINAIPDYTNDWCVRVEPDGLINGTYEYLFYESAQPNIWQREQGWVIKQQNLEYFFNKNMLDYGFNPNEIDDFTNFWIPLLTDAPYYAIYPQTKTVINEVIGFNFSVEPKNLNRLFYVIEGVPNEKILTSPAVEPFTKSNYYVNEWGVIR